MSDTRLTLADFDGRLTCSVPEAGQLIGIGRDASFAAAKRGEIPTLRLGRSLRVPLPKLLALLGIPETAPTLETDGSTDGNGSPGLRLIRDGVPR